MPVGRALKASDLSLLWRAQSGWLMGSLVRTGHLDDELILESPFRMMPTSQILGYGLWLAGSCMDLYTETLYKPVIKSAVFEHVATCNRFLEELHTF